MTFLLDGLATPLISCQPDPDCYQTRTHTAAQLPPSAKRVASTVTHTQPCLHNHQQLLCREVSHLYHVKDKINFPFASSPTFFSHFSSRYLVSQESHFPQIQLDSALKSPPSINIVRSPSHRTFLSAIYMMYIYLPVYHL